MQEVHFNAIRVFAERSAEDSFWYQIVKHNMPCSQHIQINWQFVISHSGDLPFKAHPSQPIMFISASIFPGALPPER
jgi:hypothetical protein